MVVRIGLLTLFPARLRVRRAGSLRCPRADVSYFLRCTRATKEIGDVCTQAIVCVAGVRKGRGRKFGNAPFTLLARPQSYPHVILCTDRATNQ